MLTLPRSCPYCGSANSDFIRRVIGETAAECFDCGRLYVDDDPCTDCEQEGKHLCPSYFDGPDDYRRAVELLEMPASKEQL